MRSLFVCVVALLGLSQALHAQITVQQPVVGRTGVSTSVSVPDRGSTFLGGVSSGESFRSSYGPVRTGTSRGYGLTGGSMTAHVYIIDLQAMDEAILNSVPDAAPKPAPIRRSVPDREVVRNEPSSIEKAANFERLARQAEAAGKAGVAKLHWQMAAKHGSTVAQDKLKPAAETTKTTASK